jgi:hypothetical protein
MKKFFLPPKAFEALLMGLPDLMEEGVPFFSKLVNGRLNSGKFMAGRIHVDMELLSKTTFQMAMVTQVTVSFLDVTEKDVERIIGVLSVTDFKQSLLEDVDIGQVITFDMLDVNSENLPLGGVPIASFQSASARLCTVMQAVLDLPTGDGETNQWFALTGALQKNGLFNFDKVDA